MKTNRDASPPNPNLPALTGLLTAAVVTGLCLSANPASADTGKRKLSSPEDLQSALDNLDTAEARADKMLRELDTLKALITKEAGDPITLSSDPEKVRELIAGKLNPGKPTKLNTN